MAFFGGGGASAGIGGSTGATDNAILRADGTGGVTLQNSALNIDDPVSPFSITGVASTDIITAVGHNFTTNQGVIFPTLTGGAGLTAATTVYFVRDISGDTFKVSTTSGGAAVNFTTDITAGTVIAIQANVAITNQASDTNSSIVITPKGTGAFIAFNKPDGTATGGDRRGDNAVDFQTFRQFASQVASGIRAFACGSRNTASGQDSFCANYTNTSSGVQSSAFGGNSTANGGSSIAAGERVQTQAAYTAAFGEHSRADRYGFIALAGGPFSANGDAQRIFCTLRCKTTTNSAVEMAINGSTTYLTIPSGKVMFCNIKVVGTKSDGSAVATYERQYAAKNVAGTSSEVFAPVTIGTDLASGTSLEVATVDAGDYIRIRPTGIASETWRWVASVDAVEVAYGT